MKKLFLYSFIGALAILLTNSPINTQAMDSGRMSGGVDRGVYMGPATRPHLNYRDYYPGYGMPHHRHYRDYEMGPGMMAQVCENAPYDRQNQKYLDRQDARRVLDECLNTSDNPNLKLGKIKDEGSFFEADLLTKDNFLVDKLIVDKHSGRVRSAY